MLEMPKKQPENEMNFRASSFWFELVNLRCHVNTSY